MGEKCQILLERPKEGFYRAGKPVVGTVKYFLDKPTEFTSIILSLVGEGKCYWTEASSHVNTCYCGDEEYVFQRKKILETEDSTSKIQETGVYEHQFNFILPEYIPSSYSDKHSIISYRIIVHFKKGSLSRRDNKYGTQIPVYSNSISNSPVSLTFGLEKRLLSLISRQTVRLKAEIEKMFLFAGENIKLKISVNNDSVVPITSIKTELIKDFTYVSNIKHERTVVKPVTGTARDSIKIKKRSVSNICCIVPTLPHLHSIQYSKIIIGEYKVKVTVKLPFPFRNVSVEVPVVIRMQDETVTVEAKEDDQLLATDESLKENDQTDR